jgi:glycerophosphoryl diester phosphodiesterase
LSAVDAADLLTHRLKGGLALPTLDAVLNLVGARATVYVEVKAPGIEGSLVACLDRHPLARAAVHAFDHRIPVAIQLARPRVPIGLLSTSYPVSLRGFVGAAHPQALWQQAALIDADLVRAAHELGARVVAWTENDAVHARSLVAMGVDALCTDVPGPLRAALEH